MKINAMLLIIKFDLKFDFVDDEDVENYSMIFLTTKRLISIATKTKIIHSDATYKLIWQGFPLLIVWTTDKARKFHPFGLGICTNETNIGILNLYLIVLKSP